MKLLSLLMVVGALAGTSASAAPKEKEKAAPADPIAAVAKTYGGKVWSQEDPPPTGTSDALRTWLSSRAGSSEVGRKKKDTPWVINYVAVFKKAAAKGPMTVQFVDKKDPKNLVDQYSPENDTATFVYQGSYELDPDHGFNTGHTYLVRVGQIIKGKFQPYASGELTLK
jgi:hypothetical protein